MQAFLSILNLMLILCLNIYPWFIHTDFIKIGLYRNKLLLKRQRLCLDPEWSSFRVIDYYCLVSSLVCCNSIVLPLYPALDMIM